MLNTKSKKMLLQVREAIISQKKQNKIPRETAKTSGVAKSTIWYIIKKTEWPCWAQQHQKVWKTTENQ